VLTLVALPVFYSRFDDLSRVQIWSRGSAPFRAAGESCQGAGSLSGSREKGKGFVVVVVGAGFLGGSGL